MVQRLDHFDCSIWWNNLIQKAELILATTSLTECTKKKCTYTEPSACGQLMAPGLHIPGDGLLGKAGMHCSCNKNLIQTRAAFGIKS